MFSKALEKFMDLLFSMKGIGGMSLPSFGFGGASIAAAPADIGQITSPMLRGMPSTPSVQPRSGVRFGSGLGRASNSGDTTINVYNNGDNQVTATESKDPNGKKQIDIYIEKHVKGAIASGKLDRTFRQNFGLVRQAG
jgi:hypothetical protein